MKPLMLETDGTFSAQPSHERASSRTMESTILVNAGHERRPALLAG
ncbi:hypothetical protein [Sorangium sp. So ce1024]